MSKQTRKTESKRARTSKAAEGGVRVAEHRLRDAPRVEEQIPPCAASMGCLCAGHASGDPADAPCDPTERREPKYVPFPDLLALLREGATVTFRDGFMLHGDTRNRYIDVKQDVGDVRPADCGCCDLSAEGLRNALDDVEKMREYQKDEE